MNEETVKNWIRRAENDMKIGKDELLTESPATDMICFHMQQCAEKYLKAFLIFNGIEITKTHDIYEVINHCIKLEPDFSYLIEINADILTKYAVNIRYGEIFYYPPIEETKKAVEKAEKVKNYVLEKLKEKGFENV